MSRDTKDQHMAIPVDTGDNSGQASKFARFRQRARCCIKVTPWISSISCIMIAVGLAVWYLYTKKAMQLTTSIAAQLFDQPIYLVQQLSIVVGWTTLIGVIVVSCMLGITMCVMLLRTYQFTARLPVTNCSAPGKCSYGSYAGLVGLLNFGWWLITIAIMLVLASTLCWLTLAFATSSAVTMGVRYTPDVSMPNAAYYTTAREAVDSLNTYANKVQKTVPAAVAALPEVDAMNGNIKKFVTASKEVPITLCPTSCLNVGSFYDTLRLPTSCVCTDANMNDVADQALNTWKSLVHVLAALALMGLGCLWLLMNLSAEFAYARRDMSDLPGRSPTALTRDLIAAIQATPYSATSSKKAVPAQPSPKQRDQNTARFLAISSTEFTGVDALPETVLEPISATEQPTTYNNPYETFQEAPGAAGNMLADAPAPAASPKRRPSSPSSRLAELEQPSPSNSRGATLNSTAQRYAAYRLRAAQAAAAKSTPSEGRKQWVR